MVIVVVIVCWPPDDVGGGNNGEDVDKSRMACAVVRSSGLRSNKLEHTVCNLSFSCSTAEIVSGRQYGRYSSLFLGGGKQ